MQRIAGIMLVAALTGCDGETGKTAPAPTRSPRAPFDAEDAWRRPLEGRAAFDLIWADGGPVLAWADQSGGIRALRLDAQGDTIGRAHLAPREHPVVELSATSEGGRVALAWIELDAGADRGKLMSVWGDPTSLALGSVRPHGPTRVQKRGVRGHLRTATGPDGRLLAYARGRDEPCTHRSRRRCATLGMYEIPPASTGPSRPPLVVPSPCDAPLVGFAAREGSFHYAVCNRDTGTPLTTLFTAQPARSYAQVDEVLAGCEPIGMAELPGAVWLTASCGSTVAGVRVAGVDVAPRKIALDPATLRCDGDGVTLSLGSSRTVHLDEAGDRLGAILPNDVAPPSARAVWTGEALLVARPVAGDLLLARHRCIDGSFLRDR